MAIIKIPDIGGDKAEVIEILVQPGDMVAVDDSLITLEGEKATMDVPASAAGVIKSIKVKVGDQVGEGDIVVELEGGKAAGPSVTEEVEMAKDDAVVEVAPVAAKSLQDNFSNIHAGPAVRRIARELDIDLSKVKGTGDKGRITKADIKASISGSQASGGGLNILPPPKVDFAKFGAIETQSLSKIKKISGANLHRNWVSIPHITQFDEADITELEAFRQEQKTIAQAQGIRLTPLVFIMKAVVATLKEFPIFNSSLDASGENLIIKNYYHIGVAVDTPNGLVVPVIRDVDRKGIYDLAKELGEISIKAREKGLSPTDMQGGCFTISSLGGIGGTAFTPIINAPEVAILGVSRSQHKPVYVGGEFVPRLMLPLSLSYDHRVVDGADGARFIVSLSKRLGDIRKILL